MKKIFTIILTLLILIGGWGQPIKVQAATIIHISSQGSDETGDGSENNPYLTIDKALDECPHQQYIRTLDSNIQTKGTKYQPAKPYTSQKTVNLVGDYYFNDYEIHQPIIFSINNGNIVKIKNLKTAALFWVSGATLELENVEQYLKYYGTGYTIYNQIRDDGRAAKLTVNGENSRLLTTYITSYSTSNTVSATLNDGLYTSIISSGRSAHLTINGGTCTGTIQNKNGSRFILNDGLLHNTNYGSYKINNSGGYFEMNGGIIGDNKCPAVVIFDFNNVQSGTFVMNGGAILNNTTDEQPGAGIYVGKKDKAIIYKGIISGNTNTKSRGGPFSGGGIYNDGTLELYNVAIVNNHSTQNIINEEYNYTIKGAGIGTCPTSNNYINLESGLFIYNNTNEDGRADLSVSKNYKGASYTPDISDKEIYVSSHDANGNFFNWIERDMYTSEEKEFEQYGENIPIRDLLIYSDNEYTDEELESILQNYDVVISNNTSAGAGGGIGSNGTIIIGSKDQAVKELNISAECDECIIDHPEEITATVYDKNNDKIKEVKLLKEEGYTAKITGLADLDGYYVVQDSIGFDTVANIDTTTDEEVQDDVTIKKINFRIKNECNSAQGTSAKLKKYLVVDSDSEIPETEFTFTISAGQGNDPATNSAVVYSGIEPEKVKVNGTSQTGKVKFNAGDTRLNGALDGVATTDQKYAVKDIVLDFSEVQFAEPAVYRYILTEQSNDWSAINNDPEPIRVVDVHIIWNEDETQLIVGGYVGYYGNVTDSPKLLPENYLEEEPIYVYGNLYSGGLYGASSSDMHLSYGDWDNIAFGNYYIYEDYFSQDIPRPPDPYEIAISALGLDEQGNINTGEVKNAFIFKFFSYNHIDYTEEELKSFVGDNRFIEQNLNTGQYTVYDVDIIVYDYDGAGDYYDCPPSYCTHPRLMTYRYRRHIEDGSGKPAGSYVNAQEPIGVEAGEKSDKYVNALDTANLLLAKNVSGNQSSRNQYFEFNVTVNNAGKNTILTLDTSNAETSTHANNATEYTTQVMNAANTRDDDIIRPGQQIIADDSGSVSFKVYLHHGQSITLKGIPKDATYSIIETSSAGYTTTSENSSGTITSEDVIVSFLNHMSGVVPTGTNLISSLKFLVIPITLIGYFLISKRNKDDEE